MHRPDFWDDQTEAQRVSTQYSRLKGRLELYTTLTSHIDDLELLLELAVEGGEGDVLAPEPLDEFEPLAVHGGRPARPLRGATSLQRRVRRR